MLVAVCYARFPHIHDTHEWLGPHDNICSASAMPNIIGRCHASPRARNWLAQGDAWHRPYESKATASPIRSEAAAQPSVGEAGKILVLIRATSGILPVLAGGAAVADDRSVDVRRDGLAGAAIEVRDIAVSDHFDPVPGCRSVSGGLISAPDAFRLVAFDRQRRHRSRCRRDQVYACRHYGVA